MPPRYKQGTVETARRWYYHKVFRKKLRLSSHLGIVWNMWKVNKAWFRCQWNKKPWDYR